MAPSYLIASSSDILPLLYLEAVGTEEPFLRLWTRTDGAVIESPPSPLPPLTRRRPFAFCGRASMKHRIITTELRTDLMVTTIALGAVAVCAVIGFMFALVIAPF